MSPEIRKDTNLAPHFWLPPSVCFLTSAGSLRDSPSHQCCVNYCVAEINVRDLPTNGFVVSFPKKLHVSTPPGRLLQQQTLYHRESRATSFILF